MSTPQSPDHGNLRSLLNLCLAADIAKRDADRETLGWAIGRIMELEASALTASTGSPTVSAEERRLSDLVDFICKRTRSDRDRAEREFQRERENNA